MGMQSFRLMLLSSLPRTGLPEHFESYGEFRRHLDALVRNGLIEDTTKIWWDIRPSSRYPTLETRVFDCCTHLDDAVCLAALNLSLVRMLYRLRRENKIWRRYPRMLIAENRWRAMRFGSDATLLDLARGELVPFAELLEELLAITHDDAVALDCLAETEHARALLKRGTSAHQQMDVYQTARSQGATDGEALSAVVGWLVRTTCASPEIMRMAFAFSAPRTCCLTSTHYRCAQIAPRTSLATATQAFTDRNGPRVVSCFSVDCVSSSRRRVDAELLVACQQQRHHAGDLRGGQRTSGREVVVPIRAPA